ncbi:sigma-70 family RNA polymerase sigma factor [Spectribacter hydrogenoxidans]|uniref:Sigma-70 family RNA polymerase sigma factor n=1 Tax=Spectribacter hydrogenoxidans TaxID=3075608 RepID=A0ABU3BZP7_9GAMM|nr:sigma-70 family RNA polymerase sigma factor [Salinisphaera sp. W335]MDT0634788.1 sigma-70 family RNA polymerase sigma factor [Salinisphaera sp. W335]
MRPCASLNAEPGQISAWLQAVAAGDQRAFRRLYQATAPKLMALLIRILGTEEAAEDALQDAFVKIWQKAGSFAPERGSGLTWMLTVARYQALDMMRRRRPMGSIDDASAETSAALAERAALQPENREETMQTLARIQDYLGDLPRDQRRALMLAYFRGMPYRELAQRLRVPEATIKTWVRRGLARLRERLKERP